MENEEKKQEEAKIVVYGVMNDIHGNTYYGGNHFYGDPKKKQNEGGKDEAVTENAEKEDLCHFLYPGINEEEGMQLHIQIKDLVRRFAMKDICSFLKNLEAEKKLLLPQIPQNAFDELHRLGMPSDDVEGFSYANFTKYYRK